MRTCFLDPCKGYKHQETNICISTADGKPAFVCPICSIDHYKPVCAADGKSYASECHLRKESCQKGVLINIVKQGICGMQSMNMCIVC